MKPERRFLFGHEPAVPRPAQPPAPPARQADAITEPLPDIAPPNPPKWQARLTMPLVERAASVRSTLPFGAPIARLPVVAPVTAQRVVVPAAAAASDPAPAPAPAPRSRARVSTAFVIAVLALYNVVLIAVLAQRRPVVATPDAATVPSITASPPPIAPPPPSVAPASEASASLPAPSASASAAAPSTSLPRTVPARAVRPPTPARTARASSSDVRDPWGF